ncbi:hypothetical protein EDB92DRAFT_1819714 [Lactarius akahatsu]|uniref:Uncharacterized protein n=1 Tax=Lactarius akahatsu TaxID=416441 RepID=A0AAD4Q9B2_9AGAM|nr:hypothetical protein EDB92DRAFT_1819714 [Lactarius akahatsu]
MLSGPLSTVEEFVVEWDALLLTQRGDNIQWRGFFNHIRRVKMVQVPSPVALTVARSIQLGGQEPALDFLLALEHVKDAPSGYRGQEESGGDAFDGVSCIGVDSEASEVAQPTSYSVSSLAYTVVSIRAGIGAIFNTPNGHAEYQSINLSTQYSGLRPQRPTGPLAFPLPQPWECCVIQLSIWLRPGTGASPMLSESTTLTRSAAGALTSRVTSDNDKLPEDVLLEIFDAYRQLHEHQPDYEKVWNSRDGWFKLVHEEKGSLALAAITARQRNRVRGIALRRLRSEQDAEFLKALSHPFPEL